MPSTINFNQYGFFNSIQPLNQTNWANYFAPTIPDGIISGIGDEMQVYANSSGMVAYVRTGECRVRSHRGEINTLAPLEIAAADPSLPRRDLIVVRVTYGKPSTMVLTVKNGNPAAVPQIPGVTQSAGDVWEIPLAEVYVRKGAVTINAVDITDRRFVYKTGNDSVYDFTGTTVSCSNDIEYRNANAIDSLEITLPENPNNTFITGVNFTTSASYTGVTFKKGTTAYSPKLVGDPTTIKSYRYNLVIWWDSGYAKYWCASKAVPA